MAWQAASTTDAVSPGIRFSSAAVGGDGILQIATCQNSKREREERGMARAKATSHLHAN